MDDDMNNEPATRAVERLTEERDAALTRLGAVRKMVAPWVHGEDCPAGVHEECAPDDADTDCGEGYTRDACRAAQARCECSVGGLRELLDGEPASDARTLGEARATVEQLRADVVFWKRSHEKTRNAELRAAQRQAWPAVMRVRCPNDTERAERHDHVACDVRLPAGIDALAAIAKGLSRCACGANLVLADEGDPR